LISAVADLAQLVEHILGKDEVTSSNLVISSNRNAVRFMRAACIGSKIKYADLAQLVEHILGKDEVTSSNLVISSKTKPHGH
jgi:phage/plasmid-associated DNA primase